MARLVRHDATGPIEVPPQKESIWVCACGLSQTLPYCDGSHEKAEQEMPGKLCVYDKLRQEIRETIEDK